MTAIPFLSSWNNPLRLTLCLGIVSMSPFMLIHEALLLARQMLLNRGMYCEGARGISMRRNQTGAEV